jgi:hypothetical protein
VFEVVERGCRVPGMRTAYEEAYADWCGWARAGGYSPREPEWTEEQHRAHDDLAALAYADAPDGIAAMAFMSEGWTVPPEHVTDADRTARDAGRRSFAANPHRIEVHAPPRQGPGRVMRSLFCMAYAARTSGWPSRST